MSDPQNNFKIFNEANNSEKTMSDSDYATDTYRLQGLTPMMANPKAHNKMFRQWSIMCKAVADMIGDKGYDATDEDVTDLKNNLKSSVKDLARDELSSEITTLGTINTWKQSITATASELNTLDGITASTAELNILDGVTASTAELNKLDGITASTAELNYSTGVTSNIQTQINNLSISALFPLWQESTAYSVGDVVKTANCSFWEYWECVVAGTSDTIPPTSVNIGDLLTDGTAKWLVLDMRDSNPVGTIKQDLVVRDGYLMLNGQVITVSDYPRLVNFLNDNNFIFSYSDSQSMTDDQKGVSFYYLTPDNSVLHIPNYLNLFIQCGDLLFNKINAGLPNISGRIGYISSYSMNTTNYNNNENSTNALKWSNNNTDDPTLTQMDLVPITTSGNKVFKRIDLDASRQNSIYGNSNTVQPPAVQLFPLIKY